MMQHEQYAEDLTLYAMGALEGEARAALEQHLESCDSCREELELLMGDMAALALTAETSVPPAGAKQRLMSAIAAEPRTGAGVAEAPRIAPSRVEASRTEPAREPARVVPIRRSIWASVGWLAAAAALLFTTSTWLRSDLLRKSLVELQARVEQEQQNFAVLKSRSDEQQRQLQQARETLAMLTASGAQHVTLTTADAKPQPQGKVIYLEQNGKLVFLASNLPPIPADRAYELWLIPSTGAPIPAGVFTPDAQGSAVVVNPPLPAGVEAKLFAVTTEPAGGSGAPTTKPWLVGAPG